MLNSMRMIVLHSSFFGITCPVSFETVGIVILFPISLRLNNGRSIPSYLMRVTSRAGVRVPDGQIGRREGTPGEGIPDVATISAKEGRQSHLSLSKN
eukprot:c21881_g1_i2 orf=385-675(+)